MTQDAALLRSPDEQIPDSLRYNNNSNIMPNWWVFIIYFGRISSESFIHFEKQI